jgi:membrane protein insertase Oxa1/YidC/SpoIIIJ
MRHKPQIKALQEKYASKDRETQERLQKEFQIVADNDVNPYWAVCLSWFRCLSYGFISSDQPDMRF